jgi:hypothetical protein
VRAAPRDPTDGPLPLRIAQREFSIIQRFAKPPAAPAFLTRTVVAGTVGNVLEWYDFGLFGSFAPVLAQQFLPAEDRLASLLGTFGAFATLGGNGRSGSPCCSWPARPRFWDYFRPTHPSGLPRP